jgi:hypothetical protein
MKFVIENDEDLERATSFIDLCMRYMDDTTLTSEDSGNDLFYDIIDAIEIYEDENYPIGEDEVLEAVLKKLKKIEAKLEETEKRINNLAIRY